MAEEKVRVLGRAGVVMAVVAAGAKAADRAATDEGVATADRARERRRTVVVARPSMIASFFYLLELFMTTIDTTAARREILHIAPISFQVKMT